MVRILLPAHDPLDLHGWAAVRYLSTTGVSGALERLLACTDAEVGFCCDGWCTSACYACLHVYHMVMDPVRCPRVQEKTILR